MALSYRNNPNIQNTIEARHRSAREVGIGYQDSSDKFIKEESQSPTISTTDRIVLVDRTYRNVHPEAVVKRIEVPGPPTRTRSESPQKKTHKSARLSKQRAGSISPKKTTFWVKTPSPVPWFGDIAPRPAPNNIRAYMISNPVRRQIQVRVPPASHHAILNPTSPAPYTLPEPAREQKYYLERTLSGKEQYLEPIPTEGYPLNRQILEREGELMQPVEVESFDEHPPIVPEVRYSFHDGNIMVDICSSGSPGWPKQDIQSYRLSINGWIFWGN